MKYIYAGIDVGSSTTKAVVIDNGKNIIGYAVKKSGADFSQAANEALKESFALGKVSFSNMQKTIVSTGYGRKNVLFANDTKTEISCHSKGCFHYFPFPITIIDIGGQDNKVIKLDASGRRISFKMNRKCAAGTGAFLEEMALKLDLPLGHLNDLAEQSRDMVTLGSFCTVFSATEVLDKIREGKKVEDIIKGIFFSVIKRVSEMDSFGKKIVMTGGVVAHNPYIIEIAKDIIGKNIFVPKHPQLTGAFGAALYALENVTARLSRCTTSS